MIIRRLLWSKGYGVKLATARSATLSGARHRSALRKPHILQPPLWLSMVRRSTCVSSIAPGVISRPPRLMRRDGPETQDRQQSKQCRTGCLSRETTVAGECLSPTRLMTIAEELRDLFIPSKAIEFPGVFDLIKGKQPAQAGIFAPLDIDEAEEGICCYFTTDQCKANTFSESVRQQMALLRCLGDQSLQFVVRERPIGFHHGHDAIHIADNNPRQHFFCQFLGLLWIA